MDRLRKSVEKNTLAVVLYGDAKTITFNYNYIIILYNRSREISPIVT